jgi:hypothetical protein
MITARPDERLLRALASVAATPPGQELVQWIGELLNEQSVELRQLTNDGEIHRAQGAASMLAQLFELFEAAEKWKREMGLRDPNNGLANRTGHW